MCESFIDTVIYDTVKFGITLQNLRDFSPGASASILPVISSYLPLIRTLPLSVAGFYSLLFLVSAFLGLESFSLSLPAGLGSFLSPAPSLSPALPDFSC